MIGGRYHQCVIAERTSKSLAEVRSADPSDYVWWAAFDHVNEEVREEAKRDDG